MATYNWGFDHPFKAAVDLSDYQWCFVSAGSIAGEVTYTQAVGASTLGVLQNDPMAGEEAQVRLLGTSKVKADGGSAITNGGFVKSGSNGAALGYGSATASLFSGGIALEALASGCSFIEVLLTPGSRYI